MKAQSSPMDWMSNIRGSESTAGVSGGGCTIWEKSLMYNKLSHTGIIHFSILTVANDGDSHVASDK